MPDTLKSESVQAPEGSHSLRQFADALPLITSRRSTREFTDEPVSAEDTERLLVAAMAAPSGRDLRAWDFVLVTSEETRGQLSKVHQYSAMAERAPLVVVVCGREVDSPHWVADCSAATENLLLKAASLGLGGVWVGIYPMTEREARVRAILEIPETIRVLCLLPVGHPAEPRPEPRIRFEPTHVHNERWGD